MHIQESEARRGEQLATALGWFSIALGTTELLAPRSLARVVGMPNANTSTIRAFGAREIASGVAILARPDEAGWLWSRVGGDAIDISYVASALNSADANRTRTGAALAALLGVTALDVICARMLSEENALDYDPDRPESLFRRPRRTEPTRVHVEEVITINKPIDEVYRSWKNFESFPRFMKHLDSVELLPDGRSRWRATAPAGMTVEWDAVMLEDREAELIAWQSVEGSQIHNSGTVHFRRAPGVRGTEVRVRLEYRPPAGRLGRGIAWLFGEEPEQQIREDLRRFKQLLETGEIAVSDGIGLSRAARPPRSPEEIRTLAGVKS